MLIRPTGLGLLSSDAVIALWRAASQPGDARLLIAPSPPARRRARSAGVPLPPPPAGLPGADGQADWAAGLTDWPDWDDFIDARFTTVMAA